MSIILSIKMRALDMSEDFYFYFFLLISYTIDQDNMFWSVMTLMTFIVYQYTRQLIKYLSTYLRMYNKLIMYVMTDDLVIKYVSNCIPQTGLNYIGSVIDRLNVFIHENISR